MTIGNDKERKGKHMYGVEITSIGSTYSFVADNRESVATLINNSFRVTSVKVWDETRVPARLLTSDEIMEICKSAYV
jgi:hypothetical protein